MVTTSVHASTIICPKEKTFCTWTHVATYFRTTVNIGFGIFHAVTVSKTNLRA